MRGDRGHRISVLFAVVALAVVGARGNAAPIASDDSSSSAYADGWQSGDNGGFGFGGWNLVANQPAGSFAGFILQSSTSLSGPGANIDATSGNSFGLFGTNGPNGAAQADAYRSFASPLAAGTTFSIDLAVNFRNGYKGIDVRSNAVGEPTIFNFNVGGDDYTVNGTSIGNAYSSNSAFRIEVTQTSPAGGTWSVTRTGGVSDFDTGTYSGLASSIKLYVGGTDGGSPNDLYANKLSIVPEPTVAFATLSIGLLMLRRRA